jgi:hypothetical protein
MPAQAKSFAVVSTAVTTGNLTNAALSLMDLLPRGRSIAVADVAVSFLAVAGCAGGDRHRLALAPRDHLCLTTTTSGRCAKADARLLGAIARAS